MADYPRTVMSDDPCAGTEAQIKRLTESKHDVDLLVEKSTRLIQAAQDALRQASHLIGVTRP